MIAGLCTVVYDGNGQTESIRGSFRMKGHAFVSGEEKEVSAEIAGLLLRAAPEGSVKVVKGTPADVVVLPRVAKNAAKTAAKVAAEHAARFPSEPAEAVASISPIPADVLKGISVKDEEALAFIDAGKADKALPLVALWARLGRRESVAKAAVARANKNAKAEASAK